MAYQIKRNHVVEELEIEDNGQKYTFSVDINVDDIIKKYNAANYKIAAAQENAKKAKDEKDMQAAEEALGDAVLSLFSVIFGEEQTKQIIEIYDGRSFEMLADIAPFIADVVGPRIQEAQARIAERYRQVSKRPR